MTNKLFDIFYLKTQKVHEDKYDYSKVDYVNCKTPIQIICPKHGEFWQKPEHHLNGCGCPKCGMTTAKKKKTYTKEQFVIKAQQIHGNKYDYSKVQYVNSQTKVCIICPEHGEFWQTPSKHLRGQKCPQCAIRNNTLKQTDSLESYIEKAKKVHGDKYDYSKLEYRDSRHKVCITCPEHGEFWQMACNHLQGYGCPACGGTKQ